MRDTMYSQCKGSVQIHAGGAIVLCVIHVYCIFYFVVSWQAPLPYIIMCPVQDVWMPYDEPVYKLYLTHTSELIYLH